MSADVDQVTRDYLRATYERGRKAMHPEGFEVNWADQPSRFKIYRDVERLQLPEIPLTERATLAEILARFEAPPQPTKDWTSEELSTLLGYANGVLSRRLSVNWNGDSLVRTFWGNPTFGRGTPSGGGMYPTEFYLVCGQGAALKTGIYHFDNAHHALERLSRQDATPQVRSALLGHRRPARRTSCC